MPSKLALIGICFRANATVRPITSTGAHSGRSKPHNSRLRGIKIDQSTGSDSNFFTFKRRRFYAFSSVGCSRSLRGRSFCGYRRL